MSSTGNYIADGTNEPDNEREFTHTFKINGTSITVTASAKVDERNNLVSDKYLPEFKRVLLNDVLETATGKLMSVDITDMVEGEHFPELTEDIWGAFYKFMKW